MSNGYRQNDAWDEPLLVVPITKHSHTWKALHLTPSDMHVRWKGSGHNSEYLVSRWGAKWTNRICRWFLERWESFFFEQQEAFFTSLKTHDVALSKVDAWNARNPKIMMAEIQEDSGRDPFSHKMTLIGCQVLPISCYPFWQGHETFTVAWSRDSNKITKGLSSPRGNMGASDCLVFFIANATCDLVQSLLVVTVLPERVTEAEIVETGI